MHVRSRSPAAFFPPGRHGLVAICAALAVVLGGGALLWGSAFREWWAFLGEGRSRAGPHAALAEAQSVQVRLAFLAPDGRTLEGEPRELTLKPSAPAAARVILEALRAGSGQGRGAVLPAAVQVRHVFVDKRGVAYVDLSPELLRPSAPAQGAGTGERKLGAGEPSVAAPGGWAGGKKMSGEADAWHPVVLAAQAVAATLGMSLPEIAQVQILVEGREVPLVADEVDLRRPLPASLPLRSPGTPR